MGGQVLTRRGPDGRCAPIPPTARPGPAGRRRQPGGDARRSWTTSVGSAGSTPRGAPTPASPPRSRWTRTATSPPRTAFCPKTLPADADPITKIFSNCPLGGGREGLFVAVLPLLCSTGRRSAVAGGRYGAAVGIAAFRVRSPRRSRDALQRLQRLPDGHLLAVLRRHGAARVLARLVDAPGHRLDSGVIATAPLPRQESAQQRTQPCPRTSPGRGHDEDHSVGLRQDQSGRGSAPGSTRRPGPGRRSSAGRTCAGSRSGSPPLQAVGPTASESTSTSAPGAKSHRSPASDPATSHNARCSPAGTAEAVPTRHRQITPPHAHRNDSGTE